MNIVLLQLAIQISNGDNNVYCTVLQENVRAAGFATHKNISDCVSMTLRGIYYGENMLSSGNEFRSNLKKPFILKPLNYDSLIEYSLAMAGARIEIQPDGVYITIYQNPVIQYGTYHKASLISLINNLIPISIGNDFSMGTTSNKKIYTCTNCGQRDYNKSFMRKIPTSIGSIINGCKWCAKTMFCELCGFEEPINFVKIAIEINNSTGENHKFRICEKCRKGNYIGHGCDLWYDPKEYYTCPCEIQHDFKYFIGAHNADVLQVYKKDAYCEELFGVEIEVGTKVTGRKYFAEVAEATNVLIQNTAILVYDSSIDYINKAEGIKNAYRGFEVVTRPMTYKNTTRFLKEFCKNRHPLLRSWEVGTCGIHIHVSKACLHAFEIGKILLFINSRQNRSFVKMIAKREDKRFAKFLPKKLLDYNKANSNCHYEAINTSKPHTIEFRIFRGTLNPQTVLSYMQFVKSLIEFVRVTDNANLHYKNYVAYLLATERSSYRELKARIQSEQTTTIKEDGEI